MHRSLRLANLTAKVAVSLRPPPTRLEASTLRNETDKDTFDSPPTSNHLAPYRGSYLRYRQAW